MGLFLILTFLCFGSCCGINTAINLEYVFNNYKLNKTIKIGYNIVEGFGMLTSKQTLYYIAENFLASIFIYDDDWNNISLKNLFFNVNYIIPIGSNLFITGYNHIWKTDDQLNILNQYAPSESAGYFGIYYNSTSNFIYVASYLTNSIQLFDMSLIFSSNISTSTHIPWSIAGYNNQIFAGTKDGIILVIINKIIINQFNGCNGNTFQLISILFDEFDHMATACSNQQLYLYSSKGSYQNNNISTLGTPFYIGFDSKSRFVVTSGGHGVDIYN